MSGGRRVCVVIGSRAIRKSLGFCKICCCVLPDGGGTSPEVGSINIPEAPLTDVISTLARQAGINFQFDPRVTGGVGPDGKPVAQLSPPPAGRRQIQWGAMRDRIRLLPGWDDPINLDRFLAGGL